ncbi:PDZ domain-containing protein [Geoalkalibacter halelectricus]|uniref:PDZ domain-containing protein n=1 Tax=Geoalkalibacter halelectricus TaxID=2847045 RepID=A0ABY5ZKJ5_9BACT|nr:PDZ domain-containing protein [Geoalkalibacter halelectricus]MDO3380253.1 PDZ domain-containing protein [Geoalkalibacter halelectricus]UWZ79665.1 PDZ domain-containing protein [Geoalkalibacter halelectricus]
MEKVLKVTQVQSGSQAENLGMQIGDVIAFYNSERISSDNELSMAVHNARNQKKEKVEITVVRNGSKVKMSATPEPLGILCAEEFARSQESSASQPYGELYQTKYGVTLALCSLFSFVGWAIVFLGFLAAFAGFASEGRFSLMVVLPMLGVSVTGFFIIMGAQVTRATVDNADHTREILKALRSK